MLTKLWDIKDDWEGIRSPIMGIKSEFQKVAEFDDASLSMIIKGLLVCISSDLALEKKDFEGILKVDLEESPFIHLDVSQAAVLEKY